MAKAQEKISDDAWDEEIARLQAIADRKNAALREARKQTAGSAVKPQVLTLVPASSAIPESRAGNRSKPHAELPGALCEIVPAKSKASKRTPLRAPSVPVDKVGNLTLAELIALEAAKTTARRATPIKNAIAQHYAEILNGYKLGVSLVKIAELMSQVTGLNIKHGTLRNQFMAMAGEKGDIKRRARKTKRGGESK